MPAKSIPLRNLGRDGPSVPALGFGLMGMSIAYGTIPSDAERFAVLDRAVELGATHWDTAEYVIQIRPFSKQLLTYSYHYSLYGDNEELLGKWFKRTGRRDEIFLATKFGYVGHPSNHVIDSSAKYCKEACEKSLKTLGIDCIDLCELGIYFC